MQLSCNLYQTNDTFTFLVASVIASKSIALHTITFHPIFDRPVELKRDIKYFIRIAVTQRGNFLSGIFAYSSAFNPFLNLKNE